jgi:Cu/Ag efflux protein CusF
MKKKMGKRGLGLRGAVAAYAALAVLACGAPVLLACGGGSDTGQGEGIVRAVDPVANRVTLDHGTIPGMMDAMRMDFAVTDAALLDGLAPGDRVRIAVRQDGDVYVLTEIVEIPAQ